MYILESLTSILTLNRTIETIINDTGLTRAIITRVTGVSKDQLLTFSAH